MEMETKIYEMNIILGRERSVGIATHYGLDGPGIESWLGRDFPHPSRPTLVLTQPPIQWVPVLSRGQSCRVVALTTHPHLQPRHVKFRRRGITQKKA